MNTIIVTAMLLAVAAAAPKQYETLDDNFDFTKLTTEQIGGVALCFLDRAPCNDLLNSYKKNYAIAIREACEYCNQSQKQIAGVYFGRLAAELPEVFAELRTRFDPEHKYFDNFLVAIKN